MLPKTNQKKCIFCSTEFVWDEHARCICNKCKKQSGPDMSRIGKAEKNFIVIHHNKMTNTNTNS